MKIILPFNYSEYEKDFLEENELVKFKDWITKEGISKVITEAIPENQDKKNETYLSAGKFLVDNCNYMIFVWDELKPRGKGGTAEILGCASQSKRNKGIEIIKIEPIRPDRTSGEILTLLNNSDIREIQLKNNYEFIWLASIVLGWLTEVYFAGILTFYLSHFTELLFSCLENENTLLLK